MPSLSSLVAAHGPVLVVDASSVRVSAGVLTSRSEVFWQENASEAGVAIFAAVSSALGAAGVTVSAIGAFVFCEGPGSILGIRTSAMALRAWQAASAVAAPAFSYRSLELVAEDLLAAGTPAPFAVAADARRDSWHWIETRADGGMTTLRRVPASHVGAFAGDLILPAGFRAWSSPPRRARSVDYIPSALWTRRGNAELLRPAAAPEAFAHEAASYTIWAPRIHRAPSPSRG